ncbi:MAG: M23 family metallopeptidase [Kofleriaceae bacterium]
MRRLAPFAAAAAAVCAIAAASGPLTAGSTERVQVVASTERPAPAATADEEASQQHASRRLVAELGLALGPDGALADVRVGVERALRELAYLATATPPGWLIGGAVPGWTPSSDQHPDLRALVQSPVPRVESSGYGWRDDPVRRRIRKFHKGTDFRADRGTPVLAAASGQVTFAGVKNGYGKVIYLDHGGGLTTRYAHLSKLEVEVGDAVVAGGQVGRVGATGRATGPHLHFEVRLRERAVDPVLAMRIGQAQRETPDEAAALEALLAPEVQAQALDHRDDTNRRKARAAGPRPERRGRAPRERNLL